MEKKSLFNFGIKEVVAVGIGTALFVALTTVSIPTPIPNTQVAPRMAVLAFFAALFGPLVGAIIGLIGHALGDAIFYGSVWWSWVFPQLFVGAIIGIKAASYKVKEGGFDTNNILAFNVLQVIANIVAWVIVAPVLDILIYSEPANLVFVQGAFAALGNVIVIGILGTLLLVGYSQVGAKSSSLKKED